MASCYVRAVRTALRGLHLVSPRCLLTRGSLTPAVGRRSRLPAAQCRLLHVSPPAPLCSSRTEPPRNTGTADRRAREEEEEEAEQPEYIPRNKAKNPMWKIGFAWMIGLPTSIITFILAKREVDKNRMKQLKIRQRMKSSNEGDYEGIRYLRQRKDVNMDQ